MRFIRFFDLDILPAEPVLGKADKAAEAKRERRARQRFLLTLLMYFGVILGVIGQKVMSLVQEAKPLSWSSVGIGQVLVAIIIATAIFPQVFPRVFAKMPKHHFCVGTAGWRVVQFCLAFQQGFFWQSLLSLLTPM